MEETTKRIDPRVLRTQRLLRDSLLSLSTEKGFDSITVQDITDRATLNRATFYLHYNEKCELLMDLFDELMEEGAPPPGDVKADLTIGTQYVLELLNHVSLHAPFYRSMLGKAGVPEFVARLRAYVQELAYMWLQATQPEMEEGIPRELVASFLGSAYLGVIRWWLENDQPISAEELSNQLLQLSVMGVPQVLGMESVKI
jgi:AcrR family transcriptional regulator